MLEVIDKGSCSDADPVPLLFVHGANHAAWCWLGHFLDFFADKGYRAVALNLRGNGGSPTTKPANSCSIADYVDDVRSVVENLQATPVLIGHSMGGFIVQKYLETRVAPAGVLVSSAPPRTFLATTLRGSARHPWIVAKAFATRNLMALFGGPSRVRPSKPTLRVFRAVRIPRCSSFMEIDGAPGVAFEAGVEALVSLLQHDDERSTAESTPRRSAMRGRIDTLTLTETGRSFGRAIQYACRNT